MSKRCITTRFYMDEPAGRKAWDKVQARQKSDHVSYSRAIIALLNEHDESILSGEQLMEVTRRITEAVMAELQKTLPAFIAGCVAGAAQSIPSGHDKPYDVLMTPSPQNTFPDLDDIPAPDFSKGPIDMGFVGG